MYGYDYDIENNIIIGRKDISNYGFFSTFTLLITAIMGVYNRYKKIPIDIDGTNLLRHLSKDPEKDMYKHFFHIDTNVNINFETPMPVPICNDDQHTLYSESNIQFYKEFYKRFFNPNTNILDKIKLIQEKYLYDPEKSISVIYRSTDKWTDMGGFNHISPALYFRQTRKLKEENPDYTVLIQSESDGINLMFHQAFGATFIQETLTSNNDGLPLFLHLEENKLDWAENYVAALLVHSKSKKLITYTGNSAFFIYLSRGTTKGMYQEKTFMNNNFEDFFTTEN